MIKVLLLLSVVAIVRGQYLPGAVDYNGVPNPYQFSYSSPAEGGSSSHQESGDGSGRVTGSYSVTDEDGRTRVVEYVADEGGFRANVQTNEPGTTSHSSADATVTSSADDGVGGGVQYGAGGYSVGGVGGGLAYGGGAGLAYGGGAGLAYGAGGLGGLGGEVVAGPIY